MPDGISFQPIDLLKLLDKGGIVVVCVFMGKLLFNDMAHLSLSMANIERMMRMMIRLQAETLGKNPDVVEAQMEADKTSPS